MVQETQYVHGTYLASGSVVSSPDGTVVAEVSYDAWGEARDALNWTHGVDDEDLVELGVGFTGHPAELDGGLVNMGGRMYDPRAGRFTQRDPIVADPANGADYNKYAYVRNRPLRLVDPSGFAPEPSDDTDDPGGPGDSGESDDEVGGSEDAGSSDNRTHVWDFFGLITIINRPGQRGDAADAPPAAGGACDGWPLPTKCYEAGAGAQNGTKVVRPMPENNPGLYNDGDLYKMGGDYAIGVAIGTAGGVAAVYTRSVAGSVLYRQAVKIAAEPVCFGAGTLVVTKDGPRPIEDVGVGDLVWARDEQTENEGWKRVLQVFVTPSRSVLELAFETQEKTTQVLRVTAEHPLWSLDDEMWEEAANLGLGERVDALQGPLALVGVVTVAEPETVYNFEVADAHSYFVREAGVWAHNAPCLTPGGRKVLRNLVDPAGKTVREAIMARGGKGTIVRKAGHFAELSVAEVANLAAEGNAAAAAALKLIKEAQRLAGKH